MILNPTFISYKHKEPRMAIIVSTLETHLITASANEMKLFGPSGSWWWLSLLWKSSMWLMVLFRTRCLLRSALKLTKSLALLFIVDRIFVATKAQEFETAQPAVAFLFT